MQIPLRRLAVASILLSGCFAAHALWQDDQKIASAAQVDQLIANIAVCPELIPHMQQLLDDSDGVLLQTHFKQAIDEGQACIAFRKRLDEQPRRKLAYGALFQLLDTLPRTATTSMKQSSVPLKLSVQLGQS
ncbi:MAG: hypothetical protein ACSHXK_08980 [Oceanococcus sp.]